MITFKAYIHKSQQKVDGTWRVSIRMRYQGKVKFIPTSIYLTKKDIYPSFKIKNAAIATKCEELVVYYRRKVLDFDLEINPMPIEMVFYRLTHNIEEASFTSFFEEWASKSKLKGLKNHKSAVRALQRFFNREEIYFSEITNSTMRGFEAFLEGKPRAQSLYPATIKHLFNKARYIYNDEDSGTFIIKHSLSKYIPPKQTVARKRAISTNKIREIFSLPYDNKLHKGASSRHDMALDCFKLSFCLMGMNSADLFNAIDYDGEYIIYNRTKTKDRRDDRAEMKVRVPEVIKSIVSRYRGKRRVFNFCERFATFSDFNRSINRGLKAVGEEIGITGLQFYAARHSMATIAVNEVGISKYVVNDMLCHIDETMRITDMYIAKDFSIINDANAKLIAHVLG